MIEFIKDYPAIFEAGTKESYSVFFPDILGCVSGGDTFEEAKVNAIEALSLHISGMIEDGEKAPNSSIRNAMDIVFKMSDRSLLVMLEPDQLLLTKLIHGKAKTISATIDEYILELSDKKLKEYKINRSKLIEHVLLGVASNTLPLDLLLGKNSPKLNH
ncbi:MAG: type II toxin-antitoxin system HicB family antitoxin [Sulfurimonas sp.]|nr:type II toxin-antitoxin system HicB family antitoxin [Sulfurimonas sp.]